MKKACFFQATNREGETVLIGTPKQVGKTTTAQSDIVVNDNCQDASTSLLDSDKKVDGGMFGVGFNGNGIVTTNFGAGSAFRKSLGKNVSEFEVEIDFTFSSQGKNYVPPAPQPPTPQPTVPPA